MRMNGRFAVLAAIFFLGALAAPPVAAQPVAVNDAPRETAREITGSVAGAQTRLPVPRFVSLKSDKVNARMGPTRDHDVVWIYQRAGLPVEITAEFDNWRRIRDSEGAETWVFHSMLSGRRTAMVQARGAAAEPVALMDRPAGTRIVARLEARVQGQVRACTGQWCRFSGPGFDGFIEQNRLWGVYPNEKLD